MIRAFSTIPLAGSAALSDKSIDNKAYGGTLNSNNMKRVKNINHVPVMNTGGVLLSGATHGLQGAQLGSMIAPGIGTAIGGILGAGYGMFTQHKSNQREAQMLAEQEAQQAKLDHTLRYNRDRSMLSFNRPINSNSMYNFMPLGGVLNKLNLGDAGYGINGVPNMIDPKGQGSHVLNNLGDSGMVTNMAGGASGSHETGHNIPVQDSMGNVQGVAEPGEYIVKNRAGEDVVLSKRPPLNMAQKYEKLKAEEAKIQDEVGDVKTDPLVRNKLKRELFDTQEKIKNLPEEQEMLKELLGLNEQPQDMMGVGDPMMQGQEEMPMMAYGYNMGDPNRSGYTFAPGIYLPDTHVTPTHQTLNFVPPGVRPSFNFPQGRYLPGTHVTPTDQTLVTPDSLKSTPLDRVTITGQSSYNRHKGKQFSDALNIPKIDSTLRSSGPIAGMPKSGGLNLSGLASPQMLGMVSTIAASALQRHHLNKAQDRYSKLKYRPQTYTPVSERVDVGDQVAAANMAYADSRDNMVGSSAQGRNAMMGSASAWRFRNLNEIHGNANRLMTDLRRENVRGATDASNRNAVGRMAYEQDQARAYEDFELAKAGQIGALNQNNLNLLKEGEAMGLDVEKMKIIMSAFKDSGIASLAEFLEVMGKYQGTSESKRG
jgi:hypothetical protein